MWNNLKKTVCLLVGLLLSLVFTSSLVNASSEYVYLTAAGDSMAPAITEGDMVKVKVCVDGSKIEVGDIIVYCTIAAMAYMPKPNGMWIGHRVIKKYQEDGKWYFKTKGDNCSEPDPWKVPEYFLLGVVVDVVHANVQTISSASNDSSSEIMYLAGEFLLGLLIGILLGFIKARSQRGSSLWKSLQA